MIRAMHSGDIFEMDEGVYFYWLEVLPPVYMHKAKNVGGTLRRCEFGFVEGADKITDFWREGERFFGCQSNRWSRGG